MRRAVVAVVAVAAVALAGVAWAGATGAWSDDPAGPPPPPGPLVVDASVPGHELLEDALRIDAEWRAGGMAHFAYLPEQRPPDLRGMEGLEIADGVRDLYQVGPLHAVVTYAAEPLGPCPEASTGPALCLRSDETDGPSADAPSLRYARVELTGGPRRGEPFTDRESRFWSGTALVTIDRAPWFAELVREAKRVAVSAPR